MDKRLAIIVPYRDRRKQLDIFIPHMDSFLKDKGIDYQIIIAEQRDVVEELLPYTALQYTVPVQLKARTKLKILGALRNCLKVKINKNSRQSTRVKIPLRLAAMETIL